MINQQAAFDKQLLAWDRERRRLQKRLNNPPVRVLAEPIQQGWKRHFVLVGEAKGRPDAAILSAILQEINTVVYHWRRDFQPSRRQLRLSRRTVSSEQFLRAIGIESWDGKGYPDEWHKYFRRELVPSSVVEQPRIETLRHRWVCPHRWQRRAGPVLAFAFRFPRLFALQTERHWLTHLKVRETEVETRLAEVEAYINQSNGSRRLSWLYGRSFRKWRRLDGREKILRRLAIQETRAHLGKLDPRNAPGAADAMPPPCSSRWRHGVGRVRLQHKFLRQRDWRYFAPNNTSGDREISPGTGTLGKGRRSWRQQHHHFGSEAIKFPPARVRLPRSSGQRALPPGATLLAPAVRPDSSKRTGSAPVGFLRKFGA